MKDYENTMKCYEKSNEIDPKYVAGLYFAGATYYEIAVEIQEKINALDVNNVTDYEKLSKELDSNLKKSIPYFERTFAGSEGDLNTQKAAAEYLKLIYFRFREENSENQAHYDKYNNFLIENSK
jgi:tetratricopeptide (TPR) repeat protein